MMGFLRKAIGSGVALKAAQLIRREAAKPENQRKAKELLNELRGSGKSSAGAGDVVADHGALTGAEEVWNRAVDYDVPVIREGDRALRDVLLMHGMAMNGGLLHAVEGLESAELDGAVAGLRWLGLGELADGVASYAVDAAGVEHLSEDDAGELEERGNDLYYGAVPDDETLVAAFERRYTAEPDAFAPAG